MLEKAKFYIVYNFLWIFFFMVS